MSEQQTSPKSLRKRIREGLERCVYCGGGEVAVDRDHMPPIGLFDKRQRPDKLVFPACKACHNGTRLEDLVLAFISRVLPEEETDVVRRESLKALEGLQNNCPQLLFEMWPTPAQERKAKRYEERTGVQVNAMNARGQILNTLMERFGARMGLALHYHETGRIVPSEGRVLVRWYPNADIIDRKIPSELLPLMGEFQTLREGKRNVEGQFSFASIITSEGDYSVHLCTFRSSFAVLAFVKERPETNGGAETMKAFAPGFLRYAPILPVRVDRRASLSVSLVSTGYSSFVRVRGTA